MKKFIFLGIFVSNFSYAVAPCPDLTLCQDRITAIEAQKAVQDRQASLQVANVQASISAMPSPTPSASPSQ